MTHLWEVPTKAGCDCRPDAVLSLVRARDPGAMDRAARCWGNRLLAAGRRACPDPETARDAVQDALLSAGLKLEQFRGTGSVEAWLVQMVVNACRTHRRGRKNRADWNAPLDEARTPVAGGGPEEGAARAELAAWIESALRTLSPKERAVLVLVEVEGRSGPEVARALDLTPAAVRARLSRARRHLRASLGGVWTDWA